MNIYYRAPLIYCKLFFFNIWCYIQHC